jgi:8-oxo-dGTP pyrophosphatase MutT (NUDIX family)
MVAYRGLFRERPELGPQLRTIGMTALFVLPSTSPANAAVPYRERLRWFAELREWLVPVERQAVRGVIVDAKQRVLLVRFEHPVSRESWWAVTGGGVDEGESDQEALQRELREEAGLEGVRAGSVIHEREHTFPWGGRIIRQRERFYLVRVEAHAAAPTIDLLPEGVTDLRWWTLAELARTGEVVVPPELPELVRAAAAPDRP